MASSKFGPASPTERRAERAARESYGRLLATLAARTRDLAAAEDALGDAFAAALVAWPQRGVPLNPEAWLYAAARRRLIDQARRARTAEASAAALAMIAEEIDAGGADPGPDRRLGLMFACAHPALDPGVRTALMLQTVLGLTADRIAAAFLVDPAAMGQRLVRAKAKIKAAGVPFAVPEPAAWAARAPPVLEAIYAAFGQGSAPGEAFAEARALAEEAIWLARVLAAQTPEEPEALGLLALMLHVEARSPARRDADGAFIPLAAQDCALWRSDMIAEAERLLHQASLAARPGRFQIEAAIQSAHAARLWRGAPDWPAIHALYQALAQLTNSPVARLNGAAALAQVAGARAALAEIAPLASALRGYQPYWALKAHLLAEIGDAAGAGRAYETAIALARDPAVQAFLAARRRELPGATVETGGADASPP